MKRITEFLPHGNKNVPLKAVADEFLIRREFYNPNNFAIRFDRQENFIPHILKNEIHPGPKWTILKPDSFVLLPHAYYIVTSINGDERFDLVQNFGDQIGKGNKLPSRPEIQRRVY